jgi:hypothetical protein
MFDRLADPNLYLASAERVRSRQLQRGDARPLRENGPSLRGLADDLPAMAQALSREVRAGRYVFGPVHCRQVHVGGKQRALYVSSPLDDIVLGGLAQALTELCEPSWSPRVFSYRRGRSAWSAIAELRAFLAAQRRARPKLERGLFVLRRDVRNYGDTLPADPESALYLQLTAALERAGVAVSQPVRDWLISAFRPRLRQPDGRESRPARGVPTGSPLQPLACNAYLRELDRLCERVPDAFYARFGDDLIFAHRDPALVRSTASALDREIAALGLEWSAHKSAALYFTEAGRPSPSDGFRATSACEYLGLRIDFRGSVGLTRGKLRALLGDVRRRLRNSGRLLTRASEQKRAAALCAVLNTALDPRHELAQRSTHALFRVVDDRRQLRDLDYKLAGLLAAELSRAPAPRAFRRHPPRRLRALGARSIVAERNSRGRARA